MMHMMFCRLIPGMVHLRSLTGPVPTSIGQLAALQHLSLWAGGLTGALVFFGIVT